MDEVRVILESVAFDYLCHSNMWIDTLTCYVIKRFIVVSDFQWRAESEWVNVVTQCALKLYNGSVCVESERKKDSPTPYVFNHEQAELPES